MAWRNVLDRRGVQIRRMNHRCGAAEDFANRDILRHDRRQEHMRETSVQSRTFARRGVDAAAFAALSCAAVLATGCAVQKKPAIPWTTAVLVRPVVPQKPAAPETAADAPELALEIPTPEPIAVPHSGPARPRSFPSAANRERQAEEAPVPQIVPELSAQESGELQRETQRCLNDADRNLAAASRKTLNATQADIAAKVRGFMADAREAAKVGDWPRARDLAKKAQVLSEELANSL